MEQMFHAMLVGETGTIDSREQWPEPLRQIVEDSTASISDESIRVFCLCQGFDPEYVWRMAGLLVLRSLG
jgi:hypothetical protein